MSSDYAACGKEFRAFDGPQKCGRVKGHPGAHTRDPLPSDRRALLREREECNAFRSADVDRPEDDKYERFHANIQKMLEESVGEARAAHFFEYIDKGDWEEVLIEFVNIAAGLAAAETLIEMTYEREMQGNG